MRQEPRATSDQHGFHPAAILPGVFHWSDTHPTLGLPRSSWYLSTLGVLVDPISPAGAIDWLLARPTPPGDIVLTNGHHDRDSRHVAAAIGCRVHCPAPGMEEVARFSVLPYEHGATPVSGLRGWRVGACPDDFALHAPDLDVIFIGDALLVGSDAQLGFAPDFLLGDAPEEVAATKRMLLEHLEGLLDLRFRHLLVAHGGPVVGTGHEQLRAFVALGGRTAVLWPSGAAADAFEAAMDRARAL